MLAQEKQLFDPPKNVSSIEELKQRSQTQSYIVEIPLEDRLYTIKQQTPSDFLSMEFGSENNPSHKMVL